MLHYWQLYSNLRLITFSINLIHIEQFSFIVICFLAAIYQFKSIVFYFSIQAQIIVFFVLRVGFSWTLIFQFLYLYSKSGCSFFRVLLITILFYYPCLAISSFFSVLNLIHFIISYFLLSTHHFPVLQVSMSIRLLITPKILVVTTDSHHLVSIYLALSFHFPLPSFKVFWSVY